MEFVFEGDFEGAFTAKHFGVIGYGCEERHAPGYEDRPTNNPGHLFLHFHEPVRLAVAGGTREYPSDTIILWSPWQSHFFGVASRPWVHSWFWGAGDFFAAEIARNALPADRPLLLETPELTGKYLRAIHEEVTVFQEPDPEILQNLLRNWFRELARVLRGGAQVRFPPTLLRAKRHLDAHWNERVPLADLAAIACLSPAHFSSEFKRCFGISPIRYQIDLRMQRAAHLLRNRAVSVSQVAEQIGSGDLAQFSSQFKKRLGKSPSDYRRERPK